MNKYEERSINAYNKKADNYDNTFDGQFTYKYKTKLIELIHIPEDSKLLDIACGNGRLLQMLSRKQTFQGFGCDISENMIKIAKQNNPSMTFLQSPCDALPFKDNTFDTVTVSVAFHHFPNINGFAKEALRVLRPKGTLYISEVYYPLVLRIIFNPFIRFSRAGDLKFYSPKEICRLLKDTGFQKESVFIDGNIQILQGQK